MSSSSAISSPAVQLLALSGQPTAHAQAFGWPRLWPHPLNAMELQPQGQPEPLLESQSALSVSGKLRKVERNKRRRQAIRLKRKKKINVTIGKSKELEKQLAHTKSRLMQTKLKALEVSKDIFRTPNRYPVTRSSAFFKVGSKPTASSGLRPSHYHAEIIQSIVKVKHLDRYSLQNPPCTACCELGSGTFGKCTKMLLCAMEVAVKTTTLDEYSYDSIMYEAAIMTDICHGDPNLPLFMGVYDQPEFPKPLLVLKFYSVGGKPCTFHQYMRKERMQSSQAWSRILVGVCNGLKTIHQKGYLHNDLKSDNIVLSDCIPECKKPPPVWPIIIDFGKARAIKNPKTYQLNESEKEYLKAYTHLAPELIFGSCAQSVLTDVFSLCQVIGKVATISRNKQFKAIAKFCARENPANRPSLLYVHNSLSDMA